MHRLAGLARRHAAAGVGPAAADGGRPAVPLTRRQFVTTLAGLGVAACNGRVPAAPPRATPVAIVGGGIAGLTAAHALAAAGVPAVVYEASARVGGRMHSHGDGYWDDGQVTEWCGDLIDANHATVLDLARRFELPLEALHDGGAEASEPAYFVRGQRYPWRQADTDFRPVREALARDFREVGPSTTFARSTPAAVRLDRTSVREWIESRVPGGTGSPFGTILDVAFASDYGAETSELSALNLGYLLGLERYGVPSQRQYRLAGGNARLPLRMAERLPPGSVALGWRLQALARNSDGRLLLTFETAAGTREVSAEHAILALPFAVLRTLDYARAGFDARKRRAIAELGRGRNAKLHLQFRRRFWAGPTPAGPGSGSSVTDLGYQTTYEVSRGQPGTSGVLVNYRGAALADRVRPASPYVSGADGGLEAEARWFLDQLDRVWPGAAGEWNGKASLSAPALDPNLGCSYAHWRVGQYHTLRGYERLRQGNVHFAGEHCSVEFQGYMEGGAAEGLRAAAEVRRDLGHRRGVARGPTW
jgi:monoamine oxidase